MRLGGIQFSFLAFVAVVAALAPDLSSLGRVAAQTAQPGATRTAAPGQALPANSAPLAGADQPGSQVGPAVAAPLLFSGRVIADDGMPLGEAAAVETICNGVEHIEAYTDSKGGFSFQFGERGAGVFQDASIADGGRLPLRSQSASLGSRQAELMGCELQARVPGFRSEAINLSPSDPNPGGNNLGSIIVHRMGVVEGRLVSVSSLAAPKDARKAFEKGQNDLKNRKYEDARQHFAKAAELYPEYAAAWHELGQLQIAMRQPEDARRSFQAAIKADPKFLDPYMGLIAVQAANREWQAVLGTTDQVIALDPYDYPQAYYMNAVANFNLNNAELAEKKALQAEKMDTQGRLPGIRRLLSTILLKRHEYAQAADQMRGYLRYAPESPATEEVRAQLAQIERDQADSVQTPQN